MTKVAMECKEIMVKKIAERLNDAAMLIVTNYRGLSSQDLNELRKELRNISSEYVIVKDSMAKRALAKGPNNTIVEFVEGEVGIAIGKKENPTYISKILAKFAKSHEVLKIHGGIINGALISKEDIAALAALPSKEVLLGKLANVLNAPIQGLASALSGIISKILYALNAVKEKKQEASKKPQATKAKEEAPAKKKEESATEKKEETSAEKKEEKPKDKKEEGSSKNKEQGQ